MRQIDAHIAVEYIKNSDLPSHWKNALISCLLSIPTIAPPPNDPLTLEELREMDGEPVWLVTSADSPQWAFVVDVGHEEFISFNCADETEWKFDLYGDNDGVEWAAYRRKPEEETK